MITPGTILVEKGTPLPPSFRLENEPWPSAWMSFKRTRTSQELESELATTGWTFFYMAGLVRATAFGFDSQKRLHTAIKRLITSVRLQQCNCLEIHEVQTKLWLGIPCVSVSAHSCHIQKGTLFSGHPGHPPVGNFVPPNLPVKAAA
jgi:hypothetical protein